MFDGIILNTINDVVRMAMIAFAGYLGLNGTTKDQFVAGGLSIAAGLWAWYENKGHQQIVDLLKKQTGTTSLTQAKTAPFNANVPRIILLPFALLLLFGASNAHAQMVTKTPPANTINLSNPFNGTPCTVSNCSGLTGGVDIGNGIIEGNFGAQYYDGITLIGAEVGVGAQVYTNANLVTNQNGLFSYEILKAGGSLSGLLGQTPPPPSTAPSLTANVISPYGFAGAVQRSEGGQIVGGWTVGGGIEYLIAAHLFADAKLFENAYSNAKLTNETVILAGVKMKF